MKKFEPCCHAGEKPEKENAFSRYGCRNRSYKKAVGGNSHSLFALFSLLQTGW